jgi:transglutaminase-like putative cysteine protease
MRAAVRPRDAPAVLSRFLVIAFEFSMGDFVNQHIRFDYLRARSTRTAYEAFQERVGVCRDFTHLAITLCRCLNIPARYCTGYLGDIGVPPSEDPMDFSAWFDAYLGGEWHTFDARSNVPLLTAFGLGRLLQFDVWTDEIEDSHDHPHDGEAHHERPQ